MLTEAVLASGMRVWVARPDTTEPRPAVIAMHERYGPVRHPKDLVEWLATDGFVGCLPDMHHRYEGDRDLVTQSKESVTLKDAESLADLDEAMAFLRTQSYVIGDQIGVMGVCQSGREPMLYAANRDDVSAIAFIHGGIYPREFEPVPDRPASISDFIPKIGCPVLAMLGEEDALVPLENVARFRKEMERAGNSYHVRVLGGAPHGWLDTTQPHLYEAAQAASAWATLIAYWTSTLGGDWDRSRVIWRFDADTSPDYDFSKNTFRPKPPGFVHH
jgi:carboxymethylenebutenolidase